MALAGLIPIVNLNWLVRAAAAAPGAPLPPTSDPDHAPKSIGPSTDGVSDVRPERALLFRGRKYVCLPTLGKELADTKRLLEKSAMTGSNRTRTLLSSRAIEPRDVYSLVLHPARLPLPAAGQLC